MLNPGKIDGKQGDYQYPKVEIVYQTKDIVIIPLYQDWKYYIIRLAYLRGIETFLCHILSWDTDNNGVLVYLQETDFRVRHPPLVLKVGVIFENGRKRRYYIEIYKIDGVEHKFIMTIYYKGGLR